MATSAELHIQWDPVFDSAVGSSSRMTTSAQLHIQLGFLCLIALLDGILDSAFGPALRDLQCIYKVTLQQVSLFPPVIAAGRVIGSLLFLRIRGHFDLYGVTATTMTTACCLLALVPVVPSFWMALVVSGLVGLVTGVAVHAMMVLSGEMSKRCVASIHIIDLTIYVGEFTGLLIISPFLSDSDYNRDEDSYITASGSLNDNETFASQNSKDEVCHNFRSNVMFGLLFIASLGMIVYVGYVFSQQMLQDGLHVNDDPQEYKQIHPVNKFDVIMLITMMVYTTVCAPMIFVYGQFLPTFGIYCRLNASTREVTNISLSFYACTIVGQLLGVFSSLVITQTVLINVCAAWSIVISIMLIFVTEINTTWLWVGTSALATVCAPLFSAVATWVLSANEHRHTVYGISSIADMVGFSAMSLLTGQLMALVYVQMLNYIMVGVSLLQLVLIVLLYMAAKLGKEVKSESFLILE